MTPKAHLAQYLSVAGIAGTDYNVLVECASLFEIGRRIACHGRKAENPADYARLLLDMERSVASTLFVG